MRQLGLEIKEHAAEIERLWYDVLQEPPVMLPPTHDLGALPAILYDLIEVSVLHPHDMSAHEHKIQAALNHGVARREAGIDERMIYIEFAALREAIRRYIATCPVPRWKAREALIRLDMAVSVAELAAIRGYHKDTLVQLGRWDTLPSEIARTSPLLNLPEPI